MASTGSAASVWTASALALAALVGGCGRDESTGFDWTDFAGNFDLDAVDVDPVDTNTGGGGSDVDLDADAGPSLLADGEPCADGTACGGALCLPDPDWPDGYCSTEACSDLTPCYSAGSQCVAFEGQGVCAAACVAGACRAGYECLDLTGEGAGVCLPVRTTEGLADGEACDGDDECASGTCLADPEWPGGHCTHPACRNVDECSQNAEDSVRCFIRPDQNLCVRTCVVTANCREGYTCQPVNAGLGVCMPNVAPAETPATPLEHPWTIECGIVPSGSVAEVNYEIAPSTTSYQVVVYDRDGRSLSPLRIELPDGTRYDLRDAAHGYQIATSYLFGWINPIVVPSLPDDGALLQPGAHRLVLEATGRDICWFLHEETEDGRYLDLNVYFVGTPQTAATAATDPMLAAMFGEVTTVLGAAGVEVDEITYTDVSETIAARFAVPRSFSALEQLVQSSVVPDGGAAGAMSLNVFLVRGFLVSGAPGLLGVSIGLPGPAGLHGTGTSGVTFTTEYLTDASGASYTGLVMAHEIGHYLGLLHTTETDGVSVDPLDDTPNCVGASFPTGCPDLRNLMFPYAGQDHRVITPGQSWMMLKNPLTERVP